MLAWCARRGALLGVIGALAVALAGPARARETFRIEHFDVRGSTARELRADLSRVGPIGETGLRGDAYTEYRIAWRFSMTAAEGHCHAKDIEVDLDVRMRLPRWNPPRGVSPALVDTWNRFSRNLREHEDGHHRLAIAAAQEVRRKLQSRARAGDCRGLEAAMNATANEVLRRYREKQAGFDRDTDFGRASGIRLL